jgi:hypothetical protein
MVKAMVLGFRLAGDGKATITGDSVMAADEANPVLSSYRRRAVTPGKALVKRGRRPRHRRDDDKAFRSSGAQAEA